MVFDTVQVAKSTRQSGSRRRRDGCTECKRKKVRCDFQRPTCSRYLRYPRGCTYNLTIVPDKAPRKHARRTSNALKMGSLVSQPMLNPSPLLSSADSRFYMHVFGTETALRLFPAAPSIFLQSLVSSSFQTPHLFYALLAAACSHHGRLVQDTSSKSRILCLQYTTLALSSLQSTLRESTRGLTAETVATSMALCTNDVCNGNMHIWRTHLSGAGQLLTTFLNSRKSSTHDLYVDCLTKWFTTMDVLSGMSGAQVRSLYSESIPCYRLIPPTSPGFKIDPLCGYSLDLVPLLLRVSHLISSGGLNVGTEEAFDSEITLVEDRLYSLVASATATQPEPAGLSAAELRNTHLAFVHSSLLHLHRRVRKLSEADPIVRTDITNILNAIAQIPASSSANILILWPIFSAGCETDDPNDRNLIQDRMGHMQKLGLGNFTRARELLKGFWDSNTSLPWDIYFSSLGLEMVLF
ncbi:fungal-specific transcription factor domain-containing protein [Aspergillus karnatakaensis]|uniref:Zn(II)2Cys6 transcription factor n=1 Tax=Aspergillus karnatakaensis TaxID=1810916 RepID=UPI003CCDD9FD